MGQSNEKKTGFSKSDLEAPKKVLSQFSKKEQKYLVKAFTDLAIRSPGPTIDRKTFLQHFSLPGLYGEQLFNVFDFKKTGVIDYTEFLTGLAMCLKGDVDEKLEVLFKIYDISRDGLVSKKELETMLHQVPLNALSLIKKQDPEEQPPVTEANAQESREGLKIESEESNEALNLSKKELIGKIVEDVFDDFDADRSGSLSHEQFQQWVKTTPEIVQLLDSVFNVISSSSVMSPLNTPLSSPLNSQRNTVASVGSSTQQSSKQSVAGSSNAPEGEEPATGRAQEQGERGSGCVSLGDKNPSQVSLANSTNSALESQSEEEAGRSGAHSQLGSSTQLQERFPKKMLTLLRRGRTRVVNKTPRNPLSTLSIDSGGSSGSLSAVSGFNPPGRGSSVGSLGGEVIVGIERISSTESTGILSHSLKGNSSAIATVGNASNQPNVSSSLSVGGSGLELSYTDEDCPEAQSAYFTQQQYLQASTVTKIGDLLKFGKKSSLAVTRHYILRDNLLCYYSSKNSKDKRAGVPKGVIMLSGCYINFLPTTDSSKSSTYRALNTSTLYGFEIKLPFNIDTATGPGPSRVSAGFSEEETKASKYSVGGTRRRSVEDNAQKQLRKVFYTRTESERDDWVDKLRAASKDRKFEQLYDWEGVIGSGKFATVYKCISKQTQEELAVKLLEKQHMSLHEKELLRTEIAILRLVEHENVVKLVDVLENERYIFIVTELVSGGELFDLIVGRSRFTEKEAFILLSQLLNGIEYLHSAGIMHRDIKPENILLQWDKKTSKSKFLTEETKVKLTDFGLSQLVFPDQMLDMPCGTVSYVAPEVLANKGYNVSADLWSIGVIMYLVLSGKLPFDSEESSEIKELIADYDTKEIDIFQDPVWKTLDDGLVDLIGILLNSEPMKRKTAQELRTHPWLQKMRKERPVSTKAVEKSSTDHQEKGAS